MARQPILDLLSRVHGYELLIWNGRKPLAGAGSDLATRTMLDNAGALLRIDIGYVRTHTVFMNITLSIDEQDVDRARKNASAMGTSLNQMVREYIKRVACVDDPERSIAKFERLSGTGHSNGWKFNRDELHERS